MAPIGKLYTYPDNARAHKALIAAKYNGVDIEIPPFEMGVTNRTEAFLRKFPLGKVPAFEGSNGIHLCESNAIAFYVAGLKADSALNAKNPVELSEMIQFISIVESYLAPAAASWLYPIFGYLPYNAASTEKAKMDVKNIFQVLDKYLLNRTYFVGERITITDIIICCSLIPLYRTVIDSSFRQPYVNLNRWFMTCLHQPEFKAVLGDVTLCEKMQAYQPPKVEEKPKKEEQPKPTQQAKPAHHEEEEETFEDEKPKGKNPLDLLPPSKFVMDEWKRFYSNNETPEAIKFFWDKFDPEGFSVWKVVYSYPKELTEIYKVCNLLGGFFQRLESARKYAFGSMCILGKDNNCSITGYFIFRGQDIPFEIRDCPDFGSYTFTRADLKNEATRKDFENCLAWEMDNFNQGKIFK